MLPIEQADAKTNLGRSKWKPKLLRIGLLLAIAYLLAVLGVFLGQRRLLYFPDKFLPITSRKHLTHYLGVFGQQASGGLLAQNHQLLDFMRFAFA